MKLPNSCDDVEDIEDLYSTDAFNAGEKRISKVSVVPHVRKRIAEPVQKEDSKVHGDSIIPGFVN